MQLWRPGLRPHVNVSLHATARGHAGPLQPAPSQASGLGARPHWVHAVKGNSGVTGWVNPTAPRTDASGMSFPAKSPQLPRHALRSPPALARVRPALSGTS